MDTLKIAVLGFLQGFTELLPISSSAHLILSSQLLNIKMDTYLLSVLHLGTTIALLIFYFNFLFKNILSKAKLSLYLKILLSTIPAGIVGLLFESIIEEKLRGNIYIAISLISWGIFMILIERRKEPREIEFEKISWKQSIAMGLSQIFALVPGGSRSGISTIFGMLTGLNKYTAIQYSFLLGLPLLLATPFYQIFKEYPQRVLNMKDILGILIAGVITYFGLILLKKYSKKNWLTFFGVYRISLGIIVLLFGV